METITTPTAEASHGYINDKDRALLLSHCSDGADVDWSRLERQPIGRCRDLNQSAPNQMA